MTVQHMLSVMTGPELDAWRELEQQDPYGQLREDIRTAAQTAQFAAIQGAKRITGGPFTAADFLLRFEIKPPKTAEETEEEKTARVQRMERMLLTWVRAHNSAYYARHPDQNPANQEPEPTTTPDPGATTETS